MKTKIITHFSGKYAFLRNSYSARIPGQDNYMYPSVHHAYLAVRTDDMSVRARLRTCSITEALQIESSIPCRNIQDTNTHKEIMRSLLMCKFSCHPKLLKKLLSTKGYVIQAPASEYGMFWGSAPCGGENHLGILLTEIRDALIQEYQMVLESAEEGMPGSCIARSILYPQHKMDIYQVPPYP
ncbi:MAG: NADAR family protein [Candidatus Pacebacteria bacterium]|nr:NADAR family protein [Candidatus Paceibacterota bacterium]MCD8508399.1 NADAR family protein [Candidatus Paceibacterota bacterium]MCD8528234.1 NADAR family protein [Candidatus Paceibacterota bacterium]MCD8563714.1 NADAR family protein [Candidatus Paceibacterota bacterium]